MSKEEAARKKAEIPLPLAVPLARNPSSTSSNTTYTAAQKREQLNAPLLPPPSRAYSVQKTEDEGLGRAKAEFEYASNEADDLPLAEGEVVIVVEHGESSSFRNLPLCVAMLIELRAIQSRRIGGSVGVCRAAGRDWCRRIISVWCEGLFRIVRLSL